MNDPNTSPPTCQFGIEAETPQERCRLRATHKARFLDETVRTYCRQHAVEVVRVQPAWTVRVCSLEVEA